MKYTAGDKVICIDAYEGELTSGKIYTIKGIEQGGAKTIQLEETDLYYYPHRFVLASEAGKNIEVGDTVMRLETGGHLTQGKTYEVLDVWNGQDPVVIDDNGDRGASASYLFVVVKKAEPKTDEWILWNGGKCPVPEGTLVDVRYRDKSERHKVKALKNTLDGLYDAGIAFWRSGNQSNDIVAYRICPTEKETPKSILQEAEELINGERAADYGKVSDNFANIAAGWNIIAKDGITPRKVGLMMAWVKICRDLVSPKHDNLVDGAGYFGCIDKMDRE